MRYILSSLISGWYRYLLILYYQAIELSDTLAVILYVVFM